LGLVKHGVQKEPIKQAVGNHANEVETTKEKYCVQIKPGKRLGDSWKEINGTLKTFGFSWLSQGKDSLWLKPLNMQHRPNLTNTLRRNRSLGLGV